MNYGYTGLDIFGMTMGVITVMCIGIVMGLGLNSVNHAEIITTDYTAKGFSKPIKTIELSTAEAYQHSYIIYVVDDKVVSGKPINKDYRKILVKVN